MRLPIAAVALLVSAPAAAVPLDDLADPRPGGCLDQARVLAYEDRSQIDDLATRGRAGGELVVVVIDSVAGENPRKYATRLFNKWGIDTKGRNRGVLFLAAILDHKAEIVVGDGFGGTATPVTDAVMGSIVVPRFKSGDSRGAMVEGARALVERLLLAPEGTLASGSVASADVGVSAGSRAKGWIDEHAIVFWGGLAALVAAGALFLRRWLRNRPRTCPKCGKIMVKLSEETEDKYLTHAQQIEEQLGSVDYDVWQCGACKEIIKLRYDSILSEYKPCSNCGHVTMKSSSSTISYATEFNEGSEQVTQNCLSCSHINTFVRSTPRIVRSTSSNRSSSWSGGSSSSGSSSSGSSSSGGSSSGSGSSGSW